tara:strand:+ start:1272 stop:1607 length:336 start_codon:yes stop_codon:yes gene_type:complete
MENSDWDKALNFVDQLVQDLKAVGFETLRKRPYCSELTNSNDNFTFYLFVDAHSEKLLNIIVQAIGHRTNRAFSHGFEINHTGMIEALSEATLENYRYRSLPPIMEAIQHD